MLIILLSNSPFTNAQEKCAIIPYQKQLKAKHPKLEDDDKFEQWLQAKIEEKKSQNSTLGKQQLEIITIPVVVHIIHFGENIGVGRNISAGQVDSQIDVLNEDFRRTNADASNTPSEFLPVAADVEIEFVLAKRDPEGLSTNGIVRVQGNKATYNLGDQYEMKSLSFWPSEDYLNIWVADIGDNFLGYAQFPVSSLEGLEDASNYALTDGVAIDYMAFGSEEKYPPANLTNAYNLGRTATHEVGHYLGLRHIWGDSNNCSVDDFCEDTPATNINHSGLGSPCTFPATANGCDSDDMFQNYMDYTDDGCMNIFTEDQKTRIRTVMDNSPRRANLKDSKGDDAPVVVANDLGVRKILAPRNYECTTLFTPMLEVRNYGSNDITDSQIAVKLNGAVQETLNFTHNLNSLELDTVSFSAIDLINPGSYDFEFEIISTNGTTDGNPDNDIKSTTTVVPETTGLPVLVDFETPPADWTVQNNDGLRTWEIVDAPNTNPGNKALRVDFYDYEQQGELDLFLSPTVDLTNSLTAVLSFDVAFAKHLGVTGEGLIVTVSGSCGDALTEADTVFSKFDNELSTLSSNSYFVPSNDKDWRTELIDISQYAGSETVRISFIAKNNYGNNLYIDNIGIVSQDDEDIAIANVNSPSRVSCAGQQGLEVVVKNVGIKPIGSFEIQYTLDGGELQATSWQSTDSLQLADEISISTLLPEVTAGNHNLAIFALNPNGQEEFNTDNNFVFYEFIVDESTDIAPIKETFENFNTSQWVINNPDGERTWEILTTNKGNSIALRGNVYESVNEEDWLVSPTLDFRNIETASLNYNVAYATSTGANDGLTIYISIDCGAHFEELAPGKFGDELATARAVENFIPAADSLWRNEEIDLAYLVGQPNVRIAFVSTNNNGNNIYLDDIQIYVTEHDNIVANTMYPNPSRGKPVNLTFDLDQKETITVLVYDRTGHLILEKNMPNTLNQTYTLDLTNLAEGMYFVKVVGQSFSFVKRLMQTNSN